MKNKPTYIEIADYLEHEYKEAVVEREKYAWAQTHTEETNYSYYTGRINMIKDIVWKLGFTDLYAQMVKPL
jgi:hypothetical protein